MALKTRAQVDTAITTDLPDNTTGQIEPADHRGVATSIADSVVWLGEAEIRVINMTTTAPPGSPSDRDAYVVAATATGAWAGQEGKVAVYDGEATAWVFYAPQDGSAVWNLADDTQYRFIDGSPGAWTAVGAGGGTSASVSDEGTPVLAAPTDINFAGSGVSVADDGDGTATVTVPGVDKATATHIRAGTADKYITADGVEDAAELVTLTDAATIAVDWSTFLTAEVTLGDNRTLGAPSEGEPGTWRTIIVKQDGPGNRTLGYHANYKHPSGTPPVLSTGANAEDVLSILCVTASKFYVFSATGMA